MAVGAETGNGDGSVRGQGAKATPPAGRPVTVTAPAAKTPPPGGRTSPQVGVFTPVPTNPYSSPRTQYAPNNALQNQFQPGYSDARQPMAPGTEEYLQGLADFMGHNRTPNSIWQKAVDLARNTNTTVTDALLKIGKDAGYGGHGAAPKGGSGGSGGGRRRGGGGGSGGSGGAGGASTSINYQNANEADIRALADQIGMTMMGRGISDAEFKKILSGVRGVENAKPDITTGQSSPGASVSRSQQGVSNTDREDVIKNILAKNPQYGDYQKATTMMNWFDQALAGRLQNG